MPGKNDRKLSREEWIRRGGRGVPPDSVQKSGRGVSRETPAQRKVRQERQKKARSRVKRRPGK